MEVIRLAKRSMYRTDDILMDCVNGSSNAWKDLKLIFGENFIRYMDAFGISMSDEAVDYRFNELRQEVEFKGHNGYHILEATINRWVSFETD